MKQHYFFKGILLCLCLFAGFNTFAYDFKLDGIYYNFNGGEVKVTYQNYSNYSYTSDYSGEVVIPESVTYNGRNYRVTSIGNGAFSGCSGLTSITIPNSVTSIGEGAFENCSGLTSVTIGNGVTIIGRYAFEKCRSLTSVHITDLSAWCNIAFSNDYNNPLYYAHHLYLNGEEITDLVIPDDVTSIGEYAFSDCSSLTSITIPNSVTSIGEGAFENCSGLTSVTIGNGVTSIGNSAFSDCSSLTSITIPNSVTSIGNGAFSGCSGLASITIPNSVTSIGNGAFSGCSGLASITIPNSVTSIGYSAFSGCTSLTSVTIPNSVTSIGELAFSGCSGLTSITIPNSVTSIGDSAFSGCSSLTSITINCPTVGSWFSGLTSIAEINLGESVTSIGYSAFSGCTSLTSIKVEDGNTTYDSRNDCNAIIETASNTLIVGCQNTVIPNSVTSIGNGAFYNCSGLTSITIPNSVTSIGKCAFENCSGLTSVTIGNGVTIIGYGAFYNCNSLTSITIPNSVTSIGEYAFSSTNINKVIWLTNTPPNGYTTVGLEDAINYVSNNNYSGLWNVKVYPYLSSMFEVDGVKYVPVSPSERTCDAIDCANIESTENLNIGETVSYRGVSLAVKQIGPYLCYRNPFIKNVNISTKSDIGTSAFKECTHLSKATICNQGSMGEQIFAGCSELQSVELGQEITSIGRQAFSGCSKLEGLVIPDAVETIGSNAFENCSAMTTVKIGNGVKTIPSYAFSGCSSLTNMPIGNGVTSIDSYAFNNCTSFTTIHIPQNVITMSHSVFNGCTNLKTVLMDDGETRLDLVSDGGNSLFANCPLDSVYIGRKITYSTYSSPFYRNTTLRSVTITGGETEISTSEFYGCSNLKNVRIGDGLTSIGDYAFNGCSSLEGFVFSSSIKTIGREAFSNCTAITSIVSKATTPPTCGTQALDGINKWTCTLTVPQGYLTAYQQADQWKDFFFINEGNGDDTPIIPNPEKCATPTISYAKGELKFNCETEEVQFISIIKDDDIKPYYSDKIELGVTYIITVYATKSGYIDSDVATATLCWIDVEPATEGIVNEDAVKEVKAMPVLIQTQGGTITIQGATEGSPIAIYSVDGKQYGSAIAEKDSTTIATSIQPGSVAVVKIGEKAVKVLIK